MNTAWYKVISCSSGVDLVSIGVSISRKPSFARNALVRVATLLLMIILDCISGLLKSKHLYLSLISSLVLIFSSIGKGGVSDSERILKDSAAISISPVLRFSLTAPLLFTTLPTTAITNSFLKVYALSKPSLPMIFSSKVSVKCHFCPLNQRI